MGSIDAKTKQYVRRPNVFADLFNYLLYNGEDVLKPENLTDMDTAEIALPTIDGEASFPIQKYRDVLKEAVVKEDGEAAYVLILGVENQDNIHYAMPVKNMVYDAINYSSQVSAIASKHKAARDSVTSAEFLSGLHKSDKLTPVITLTLYFGQHEWDAPMSLHELLSTEREEILQFVPDFKINLISPVSMSQEDIRKFKSDFKELAAFIRCGRDKEAMKNLVETNEEFKHMDPLTAEIANDVTRSNLKLKIEENGEVDMCIAIAGIRDEGREMGRMEGRMEGREQGRLEGREQGRTEGEKLFAKLIQRLLADDRLSDLNKAAVDENYRHLLMEQYGLN